MEKKLILNVPVADYICQLIIEDKKFYEEFISEYNYTKLNSQPDFTVYIKRTTKIYPLITILKNNSAVLFFPPKMQIRPRSLLFNAEVTIACLLIKRDIFFLHASSFELNGKAYVFCGPSHAGKSTILKMAKNSQSLGDDTTVLKKENSKYYVYPSPFDKKKVKKGLKYRIPIEKIFILQKANNTSISHLYALMTVRLFIDKGLMLFINTESEKNMRIYLGTESEKKLMYKSALDLVSRVPVDILYFTKSPEFLSLLK